MVKQAVMETIERYIVVEEDRTEMFMKAVIISLMLPDDRFAQSKVRAKMLDGINYFLKLAIADYMLEKQQQGDYQKLSPVEIAGFSDSKGAHLLSYCNVVVQYRNVC